MKKILCFLMLVAMISCATDKKSAGNKSDANTNAEAKEAEKPALLTLEDAEERKERVSTVSYDLDFDLTGTGDEFSGTVAIEFDLKDSDEDLRVDFNKGKVSSISVNGVSEKIIYDNIFISIPSKNLKEGYNKITINFTHDYSKDGSGLYKYIDKEDKRVYLYSDLEPYDANRIFPCFDQPNLKAHYKMRVTTPKSWVVSTYAMEESVQTKKDTKTWTFPRSAKFSTYIWSLHAGEYAVVTDKKAKYPSRLFMRKSMKKYVKINDWQVFTRQSFEFLDDYFGVSYPYGKYDQLIVPDFNAGAMENVAAVTFSERYVSRGEKTQALRRRNANVIFHEMAHMWFGNLVTMDWWNDLWLNESFATYIANLGVSRVTEFKDTAWRDFNGTKQWAYWEDQLVTTHPIVTEVPDTNQAFANFDGITYGKGASSLKQIHYYLGEDAFKKGLKIYFRRHATENTKLSDFIGALSEGAGYDLGNWQEKWLESTGVNRITASNLECKDGMFKGLLLKQSKSSGDTYRPHSFEVAFLKTEGDFLKVYASTKVKMDGESYQVTNPDKMACPEVIYANYNDHDYITLDLDDKSLAILEKDINQVRDDFLRQMMWTEIWTMVYYGRYSYKKYYSMALNALEVEKDPIILDKILTSVTSERRGVRPIAFHDANFSEQEKKEIRSKLYDLVKKRLLSSKAGSESQKFLYFALVNLSESKSDLDYLVKVLDGKVRFKGLTIDQDKRWKIVKVLNRYEHPLRNQKFDREKSRDNSSRAQEAMIAIDAMDDKKAVKEKWITAFRDKDEKYSFSQLKQAIYNLFPMEQKKLKEEIFDTYLAEIGPINDTKEGHIAMTFAGALPTTCSKEQIEKLDEYISDNKRRLKAGVLKRLRIALQENQRCLESITAAYKPKE
ncbi:MAG: aminopeptidase N [Halobacteriovoraceae bacterium]|nr:aminopeptidase N [Halobacteriovoraceae bacterium]|tara:strand:+ start:12931 stop:15615 length:2685 start_codon:yes stop_codon:yes gene_type:complete